MKLLFISFQSPLFKGKGVNYKLNWILTQLENNVVQNNLSKDKDLVFVAFPEYFLGRKPRNYEEIIKTEKYSELIDWSKENDNIVIIPGSMALYKKDKILNQAPVIFRGKLVGVITKQYPFGREIEYGVLPGKEVFYTEIKGVKVGGVICADLWYPHLFDRKKRPLDVLIVPTQAVVPSKELIDYGRFLWQSLTVTRAKEQVVVVMSSDLAPTKLYDDSNWHTSGSTFIINPTFRFTNEKEFSEGIKSCGKNEGYCYMETTLEKIREYKDYRNKMFYDYS